MEQVKIGFLGAGNMGSAIMRGIAGSKLSEQVALYAYDHMPEKTAALAEIGVTACTSEAEIVKQCKYVFLAKGDSGHAEYAVAVGQGCNSTFSD